MKEEQVALNFWGSIKSYPDYPNTLRRRLLDVNFVVNGVSEARSLLDIGCGDGSMLLSLREFTEIDTFYGYDVSPNLIDKLLSKWGWGNAPELITGVKDVTTIEKLSLTDVTLSMGFFLYIFEDSKLLDTLEKVKSELLIVRAPCTLKEEDEVINKFSEDLGEHYAAVYRTVPNYTSILSKHFNVTNTVRAYPDSIESKYGTKHYFFVCSK